jgi:hypothetical protein
MSLYISLCAVKNSRKFYQRILGLSEVAMYSSLCINTSIYKVLWDVTQRKFYLAAEFSGTTSVLSLLLGP